MDDKLKVFMDSQIESIAVLYMKGLYVQSAMLLYASIDQMAWLSVKGESEPRDFKNWIDRYFDKDKLSEIGVSADELWEARNSLLHMSTSESRKIKKQSYEKEGVIRKIYYMAGYKCNDSERIDSVMVDLFKLCEGFFWGANKFVEEVRNDREAFPWMDQKLGKLLMVDFPSNVNN